MLRVDTVSEPPILIKPLLRGWSHVVALGVLLVLGSLLIARAADTARGSGLMVIYVLGTAAMFGVSAAYHRLRWTPRVRVLMSKLDHCTIFLAIAGAYTPVAVVGLSGNYQLVVLCISWGGAVVGISLQWLPFHLPLGFSLILGGGVAYTIGALVYALKRPDPWPQVFGYHEVFHVFTIIGAGLHFAAIYGVVLSKL